MKQVAFLSDTNRSLLKQSLRLKAAKAQTKIYRGTYGITLFRAIEGR